MKETLELLKEIECQMDGLSYTASESNNCTAALLSASIEHGMSIMELLGNGRISSAYALVRPMFESFTRGTWVLHCATEEQVADILSKDRFPISFLDMLKEIEKINEWVSTLSEMWKRGGTSLHSYTHGGVQLIIRRINGRELYHKPNADEIKDLLTAIIMITSLSFSGLVELSGTDKKGEFLKYLYEQIEEKYIPAK